MRYSSASKRLGSRPDKTGAAGPTYYLSVSGLRGGSRPSCDEVSGRLQFLAETWNTTVEPEVKGRLPAMVLR